MRNNHEIDYRIFGEEMQCVEIELDPQETVVAESGAFMYMDDGVQMETVFGDGSQQNGGFFSKLMGAGKRLLTGESLFMTTFTHQGMGKAKVAFASPYPGKIIALDLQQMGGKIVCQKDAFLHDKSFATKETRSQLSLKLNADGYAFRGAKEGVFLTHYFTVELL